MSKFDCLSKREPLNESDLSDLEEMAFEGDDLVHRAAQRLLIELRRAWHDLADPQYMYAGGRVHRHAILCRNAEVDELRQRITAMENRASVVQKVTLYVNTTFGGDWQKAFNSYAVNGLVSRDALLAILKAAGVGFALGRPFVAAQVMEVMDANGDGSITWDEFQSLAHTTPPAPPPVPPPAPK